MAHQPRGPSGDWNATLPPRDRSLLIFCAVILSVLLVFGALIASVVAHSNAVYAEFMNGCERDHKHYECMLLWRATQPSEPTVVPIPIPIPGMR